MNNLTFHFIIYARFLESTGVLARMARLLDDGQNHPFASILVPGLVKFFGTGHHNHMHPHVALM